MKIPGDQTPAEYIDSLKQLMGLGCPTPEKKRFPSWEGALRWRDAAKKDQGWTNNLYPYKCIGTAHWHLSSKPQEGW